MASGVAGALAVTPRPSLTAATAGGGGGGGGGGSGGAGLDSSTPRVAERKLISQLLKYFKQTAEVRQYLKYYGGVDMQRFAIIKISGDVMHNPAETARVAAALAFLHRIGLLPIVVHGAGLFTGRRSATVTDAAAVAVADETPEMRRRRLMAAATTYMNDANAALVEALRKEGVEAESLSGEVFSAVRDPDAVGELAGITGAITRVNVDPISTAIEAGRIPVVASLGGTGAADDGSDLLTFSTQDATMALAKRVQPLKVIWLRPEGALRAVDGTPVHDIDLARDAPHLHPAALASAAALGIAAPEAPATALQLRPDDAASLAQLAQLYEAMDEPGCSVSITDPEHLAGELFTHRGEGTNILRGERIVAHDSLDTVDVTRLTALIQDSFRATLPPDYFATLAGGGDGRRRLRRIYVSEDYRGVAIVTEEAGLPGVAYLDKFAVASSAQGDKLGEVLWKVMVSRETELYWRSRSSNKVNPWYYEQSTGCYKNKGGDWTVFWRGLPDDKVMPAIACAIALPPTFPIKVYPAASLGSEASLPATRQPVLK